MFIQRFQSQSFWRSYFVLVVALTLTACAAFYGAQEAHEQDRVRFERMTDRTHDAMTVRLRTYVAVLRGGAGLIHASASQRSGTTTGQPFKGQSPVSRYLIGRTSFRNYARQLRLQVDFPGIQGIGFSARVPAGQNDEFVAALRRENTAFHIWPELKAEFGPDWHSIVYLEPMDERNRAAIGFNMYSEPTRRAAMQKARDSGEAAASAKVLLKQEITPDKQSGFLIYIPVYQGAQPPLNLSARRTQLVGFVYSPFRAGDFLENLLDEPTQERLLFQLYDDVAATPSHLLYQSATLPSGYAPQYSRDVTVYAAGRNWNLRMMTRPAFDSDSSDFLVPFIIIAGLFISIMLFAVTWTQAVAYNQAEQTAQELRQSEIKREKLLASEHQARLQAEEASRSKDEFLAVVSHELRTPLTSILGWAGLIRNSPLDEENRQRGLQTIERNAQAQAQLIEDLLDMSRIVSGRIRLESESVDVVPILDAALDAVRPAAQAKSIELWRHYDLPVGCVVGDAQRLQQIVWNLLTNAIKFTPNGGRVELLLSRSHEGDNEYFEIRVKDSGIGMEPEFVPHAFDRFRQADASATRSHSGLGLGLSIVRHLTEMHGGEVSAHSQGKNQGSTFTLRLPVLKERPAREDTTPQESNQAISTTTEMDNDIITGRLHGKKILVVEDEADTRQMIGTILQAHGVQVQAVESAAEALRTISSWKPDILVSDIGLPGEDGYSLMRRVRALPSKQGGTIPALALTAFARESDRLTAIEAGFQRYLTKPVSPRQLAATIASLLSD